MSDTEYRPLFGGIDAPQATVTGIEVETQLPDRYTVAYDDGYDLVYCTDGVAEMVVEHRDGQAPVVRNLLTGAWASLVLPKEDEE